MSNTIPKIIQVLTRNEKKRMGSLMVLDIIISITDIVFLALLLFIIHLFTENAAPSGKLSFLSSRITGPYSLLFIVIFFLLFSVKNLLGFLVFRAQGRFVFRVASRISREKLVDYLEGNYSGYTDIDSSVHIREISYQPLEFAQHVLGGLQQIITQSVLIILAVAGTVFFNAKLFLLILLIILPPVFILFYFIRRKMRSVRQHARTNSEKSLQHLQEALTGFVESNIYHKNDVFLDRYLSFQLQYNKYLSEQSIVQGIPGRMIEIFSLLGIVVLIAISKWSGGAGNMALTTIGVFMAAAYKIIPGIVKILSLSGEINTYAFTLHNLAARGHSGNRRAGFPVVDTIRSVRFKNVRFSYNGHSMPDYPDLCLTSGDFAGMEGPSGKGKTTILNLLLGFLEPDQGEILINGKDAGVIDRQQYWQRISYVKQQPFLLHDTILFNITLNGRDFDKERLQTAIRISGLSGLIDSFPEGLDKIIAENGRNISGGQRQRIAIARALYKEADLIILDEPFNELDEGSESDLLAQFQRLSRAGKLILLITHNRKSLSFCNKILSLYE